MMTSARVNSLLSGARKPDNPSPPRILFYGDKGLGKTTMAAKAPGSIILNLENGCGNLEDPVTGEPIDCTITPLIETYDQFMDTIDDLIDNCRDYGYQTVVIDTLTKLDFILQKQVLLENGVADEKGQDKGAMAIPYGGGKPAMKAKWGRVMRKVTELNEKQKVAVIMTAHTQEISVEPPTGEAFTKMTVNVFTPKEIAPIIAAEMDYVGYIGQEYGILSAKVGMKDHRRAVATTTKLNFGASPVHDGKARNQKMPDQIDPFWECFAAYLPGSDTKAKLAEFAQHRANYSTN